MKKRNLLVAGVTGVVLTAGSVTFGATALAAPSAPALIKACVADKGGAMYQVSAKTTKCSKGQHLVTWNQTGVQGASGKNGATGATGKTGATGAAGKNGLPGAPGKDGAAGAPGLDGLDGTNIAWGVGPAGDEVVATSKEGDFYFDLTVGNTTVAVFDGEQYGEPVPLQGAAGKDGLDGKDGVNGTRIQSGVGAASEEIVAASKAGDLYLDLTPGAVTLAAFDGTAYGVPTSLQGAAGKDGADGVDGKSLTVNRETVAAPTAGTAPNSLVFRCTEGEVAIGAGYSGVTGGAQVVGSDAGALPTDWVVTFDSDPGNGVTGTALCAATV